MAAKRDCYEILGLSRDADASTIKKAYRRLAKKYHPDTNPGDARAEERFKEITDSYNILSDPEKKKLYDQFGYTAFDAAGNPAEGAGQAGFGGFEDFGTDGFYRSYRAGGSTMSEADLEELLKHLFRENSGDSRDYFRHGFRNENLYGRSFGEQSYDSRFGRGQDLHSDVTISFREAVLGCEKRLRLSEPEGFSGQKSRTLQVRIPAGIEDGKSIRLKGQGISGPGGIRGDLLLQVHVTPEKGFERKGADIFSTLQIPFVTACLGGTGLVSTVYGDVSCQIRPGTQSGSRIRLKGKGAPLMGDPSKHGDMYVTIQIQVPRHLNSVQERKLREFAAAGMNSAGGMS